MFDSRGGLLVVLARPGSSTQELVFLGVVFQKGNKGVFKFIGVVVAVPQRLLARRACTFHEPFHLNEALSELGPW
jgi:hypothetical protein